MPDKNMTTTGEVSAPPPTGALPDFDLLQYKAEQSEQRENKRSSVRQTVTYWMLVGYILMAAYLIITLVDIASNNIDQASLYLQTALGLFAGVASAALGVIGFWFGNRDLSKQSNAQLDKVIEALGNQGEKKPEDLAEEELPADLAEIKDAIDTLAAEIEGLSPSANNVEALAEFRRDAEAAFKDKNTEDAKNVLASMEQHKLTLIANTIEE